MIAKQELILAVGVVVAVVSILVFVGLGVLTVDAATQKMSYKDAKEYIAILNHELATYPSVRPRFYNSQQFLWDLSYNVRARTATARDASISARNYTPEQYAERKTELVNLYLGI